MVGRGMQSVGRMPRAGRRVAGFTMIEMLIIVAVIAILGVVAFPSYSAYMVRAHRSAASSFMLEVASRQERALLDSRGYATSLAGLPGMTVPESVARNYTLTTTSPRTGITTPSYEVKAVPIGRQLARDTKCATLTITEAGTRAVTGTGTVSSCWDQ